MWLIRIDLPPRRRLHTTLAWHAWWRSGISPPLLCNLVCIRSFEIFKRSMPFRARSLFKFRTVLVENQVLTGGSCKEANVVHLGPSALGIHRSKPSAEGEVPQRGKTEGGHGVGQSNGVPFACGIWLLERKRDGDPTEVDFLSSFIEEGGSR